jgi:hypothetical protein
LADLANDFLVLSGDSAKLLDSGASLHGPHLQRLNDEFDHFTAKVNDYLVEKFPDDDEVCLEDFWPDLGWVWLCVRMGHGVGFADSITDEFRHVADFAKEVAKSQPFLEDGAYLSADNVIYAYNYHG